MLMCKSFTKQNSNDKVVGNTNMMIYAKYAVLSIIGYCIGVLIVYLMHITHTNYTYTKDNDYLKSINKLNGSLEESLRVPANVHSLNNTVSITTDIKEAHIQRSISKVNLPSSQMYLPSSQVNVPSSISRIPKSLPLKHVCSSSKISSCKKPSYKDQLSTPSKVETSYSPIVSPSTLIVPKLDLSALISPTTITAKNQKLKTTLSRKSKSARQKIMINNNSLSNVPCKNTVKESISARDPKISSSTKSLSKIAQKAMFVHKQQNQQFKKQLDKIKFKGIIVDSKIRKLSNERQPMRQESLHSTMDRSTLSSRAEHRKKVSFKESDKPKTARGFGSGSTTGRTQIPISSNKNFSYSSRQKLKNMLSNNYKYKEIKTPSKRVDDVNLIPRDSSHKRRNL